MIRRRPLAVAIVRLAAAVLPISLRPWGQAMCCEVEAIERPGRAVMFALGCLGFAVRQAIAFQILRPLQLPRTEGAGAENIGRAKQVKVIMSCPQWTTAFCAISATGLGLAYMGMAGAPFRYLATNAGALATGFAITVLSAFYAGRDRLSPGLVAIGLGLLLLATSFLGTTVEGATRWIAFGPLFIQPSLIVVPVMVIAFARFRDGLSAAGIAAAALALAMQPDRAMAGALAASILALGLACRGRNVMIALAAATGSFLVTMARPDILPAMPFVDQILYSAFAVHPLAGMAVAGGSLLLIVPALAGWRFNPQSRAVYAVFGAVWGAIAVAAALGNYPTPVVGYGGSAIIGYVVSLLGLPKHIAAPAGRQEILNQSSRDADQERTLFTNPLTA